MTADANELVIVLANTLSPNAQLRESATKQLTLSEASADNTVMQFLDICLEKRIPLEVRQASVLRFKRMVDTRYDEIRRQISGSKTAFADGVTSHLRARIVGAIVACASERPLLVQMIEVLRVMVAADFPERWPGLVESLVPGLSLACSHAEQLGALAVMRVLFRRAHYHRDAAILDSLNLHVLPHVLTLFKRDVQLVEQRSSDALARCRWAVKIFRHACHWPMSASLCRRETIAPWCEMILRVLSLEPANFDKDAIEQRPMLLKVQKWVLVAVVPMLQMYGRPDLVESSKEAREFAEFFSSSMAPELVKAMLKVLSRYAQPDLVSDRILQLVYSFLSSALKHAALYALIKPHLELVLVTGVYRTLCRDEEELEMFEHDPEEFVRRSLDAMQEFEDPRVNASNMLIDLVRIRTRDSLHPLLQLISSTLSNQASGVSAREGVLSMLGSLSRILASTPELATATKSLLNTQVVPLLSDGSGVIRARAAWLCGHTATLCGDACLGSVLGLLSDQCLPVRIEAAQSFARILKHNPDSISQLGSHLAAIFERYIGLVDCSVAGATILASLEEVISRFDAAVVAPHALALCERVLALVRTAVTAPETTEQNDDDEDESGEAILSAFRVLDALVKTSAASPQLYAALEARILPVISSLMCEDGMVFLDDVMALLSRLASSSPVPMSTQLHAVVPHMNAVVHTFAQDYLSAMVAFIRQVIARDVNTFMQLDHPSVLVDMAKHVLEGPMADEDGKYAAQLFEVLLGFGMGHERVLVLLPAITQLTLSALLPALGRFESDPDDVMLEFECCVLLNVLSHAMYFNAAGFVSVCSQLNCIDSVVTAILMFVDRVDGEFGEMMLIGLASLLPLDWNKQPVQLRQKMGTLLNAMLLLCSRIRACGEDEDEEENHMSEPNTARKGRGEIVDVDTNLDFLDQDELKHMKLLHSSASGDLAGFAHILDGDISDDDDEGYESENMEEYVQPPTSKLNAHVVFAANVTSFSGAEQWRSSLSADLQKLLQDALDHAAKSRSTTASN